MHISPALPADFGLGFNMSAVVILALILCCGAHSAACMHGDGLQFRHYADIVTKADECSAETMRASAKLLMSVQAEAFLGQPAAAGS
jgi:hypothetical protein